MSTTSNGNFADELSSSLQQLSINLEAPLVTKITKPYANLRYVEVSPRGFEKYFSSIWKTIVVVLGNEENHHAICYEPYWVKVCSFLLQERVDYVYSNATSTVLTGQSLHIFPVPKCLSELLNNIGIVTVFSNDENSLTLCPRISGSNRLRPGEINHMGKSKRVFSQLVVAASARGFLNTGHLTNNIEGSPWWALTIRLPGDIHSIATGDEDVVQVYGRFSGFSLEDELRCAIVQNQFDGTVPNSDEKFRYHSENQLKGVLGLREVFNLKG